MNVKEVIIDVLLNVLEDTHKTIRHTMAQEIKSVIYERFAKNNCISFNRHGMA